MAQLLTREIIDATRADARLSARKRAIFKFHSPEERCQRMINVLCRGTYVQPHRHLDPPKVEHFTILEGKVAYVSFTENGEVAAVVCMDSQGPIYGVDIKPGEIHSLVCLSDEAVMHEIIDGVYDPTTHKDFMSFAPSETDPHVQTYLTNLESTIQSFLDTATA